MANLEKLITLTNFEPAPETPVSSMVWVYQIQAVKDMGNKRVVRVQLNPSRPVENIEVEETCSEISRMINY